MINRVEEKCPYCDTQFMIEFELEDDELVFCPSCGEELPDPELEREPWQEEDEDEYE